jgi:hypothetical protein
VTEKYQQTDAPSQLHPTENTAFSIAHQTSAMAHEGHYPTGYNAGRDDEGPSWSG